MKRWNLTAACERTLIINDHQKEICHEIADRLGLSIAF
jgi:hypothetical protein